MHRTYEAKTRVISTSQPNIELSGHQARAIMDLIAYCARVSAPDNQNNYETGERLINYLIKHKHWSPLEMVSACIEIETTRDIARQILRHRSFSFQEYSQRYADPTKDLEFVIREARLQDEHNRQNSVSLDASNPSHTETGEWWDAAQREVIELVERKYTEALSRGIAKEQARAILPEGNTVSRMYMNGTLRSWLHFIDLRSTNGTQKEHMEVARAVGEALQAMFPMTKEYIHYEI